MGFKEGETIRINVKPKPTTNGTGMLSAALSGTGKPKPLALAPPPKAAGITRSPLPPPPNDPVASRIASDGCKESIDNTRRRNEPLSDLSQLKVNKPCLINWIYSSLKLRLVILDLVYSVEESPFNGGIRIDQVNRSCIRLGSFLINGV